MAKASKGRRNSSAMLTEMLEQLRLLAETVQSMIKRCEKFVAEESSEPQTEIPYKLTDETRVLRLGARARKALIRLGATDLKKVTDLKPDQILSVRNTGEVTLNEIRDALLKRGLKLRND